MITRTVSHPVPGAGTRRAPEYGPVAAPDETRGTLSISFFLLGLVALPSLGCVEVPVSVLIAVKGPRRALASRLAAGHGLLGSVVGCEPESSQSPRYPRYSNAVSALRWIIDDLATENRA
ncbi:hypothetical protein BS329_37165 [Amycolatopsis coloradensis]|uniref:Uncharacterized protein n=1 Tax=Amycolatopsis coloradensis TaxID=76021 RepID=A0A1R0KFB9_9PSEU|nr:hypothetical protein BS329_37165 [Amycolatopsis coloradensis]